MILRNSKPKMIVQLCGGLGNQMFQYAAARSLAARNDSQLILDDWSGFVRDTQYKRHYELDALPTEAREARPFERLPFWIDRVSNKVTKPALNPIVHHLYGIFVNETRFEFLPEVFNYQMQRSSWMTGYWQSAKYFAGYEALIQRELTPKTPDESHFLELGKRIRETNSIALGVRLYEESTNPGAHAADGKIKSVISINQAVIALAERQKTCHFFVFCTHRSAALEQLDLRGEVTYVTHDDGYEGTLQRLWLLTQCRHHIITNSSYYWWGAWLSRNHYIPDEQMVYAADNFINKDSVLPEWQLF